MPTPESSDPQEDPVAAEIKQLRSRLAGGVERLNRANDALVDEAEGLARDTRGSRSKMRAVTGPHRGVPTEPSPTPPPGVTARFRALR